jgi:ribosomal protein RSM22 (predicted rRNA methylase)
MQLPPALRLAIDAEVSATDRAGWKKAAGDLSRRYRTGEFGGATANAAERAAYLLTRLPATYAANALVFQELRRRVEAPIRTVLDLGSGPGTALWAASEQIPGIASFTAVERNREWIGTGQRLAAASTHRALRESKWLQADLRSLPEIPRHDVVVLSYAAGELGEAAAAIDAAWQLAEVALVIVEPGTPKAFQGVIAARDRLIGRGATIAAPCPHHNQCPLAACGDWCHFRARLERSSEHRRLKDAELGYEDEKFSYVIASKGAAHRAEGRIVRHPLKRPGHVRLALCTPEGLQSPGIGKSKRELYRQARNADWGDAWPS